MTASAQQSSDACARSRLSMALRARFLMWFRVPVPTCRRKCGNRNREAVVQSGRPAGELLGMSMEPPGGRHGWGSLFPPGACWQPVSFGDVVAAMRAWRLNLRERVTGGRVHKTCFACHAPAKDRDFLFTRYAP
jgi:hypothetical protein